jgi:phosphatidylinositol alpha-1,6-mannosyltransferase
MNRAAAQRADESRGRWWFVMRKYPPGLGGMERLSFEVTTRLALRRPIRVVALANRRQRLPAFFIGAACRLVGGCIRRDVALVHLGDAVLAPLGVVARAFGVPCSIVLHGLDIVHDKAGYPLFRRLFLRGFSVYICNSAATRDAAILAGIPAQSIQVIGAGVDARESTALPVVRDLNRILFIGRLVRRKGLRWFVTDVLPALARHRAGLQLIVLGEGPERRAIEAAATAAGISDRLVWLGAADDETKMHWLARVGACIIPNIAVRGDMEGFGIVALEAAAAGCPVIAADIEGLRDAVADGTSGALVRSGDARAWRAAIDAVLADAIVNRRMGERARAHVLAHYGWGRIVDAYDRVLSGVARDPAGRAR